MAAFQRLLHVADTVEPSGGWDHVATALVPLAAIALQCADRVPGLGDVLAKHGWNGSAFVRAFDLDELKRDLWALYGAGHEARLTADGDAGRLLPPPPVVPPTHVVEVHHVHHHLSSPPTQWHAKSPVESFKEKARSVRSVARYMPEGRIVNELTHYAQLALTDIYRLGLDGERFKYALRRGGYDLFSYSFKSVPDMDELIRALEMM